MNLPQRGEVWLVDFGLRAKVRPALILSIPFGDADYALFHVVPHTTAVRNSHFEVAMALPWLKQGTFNIQGSQSVPQICLLRRLGILNHEQIGMVEAAFRRWLAI